MPSKSPRKKSSDAKPARAKSPRAAYPRNKAAQHAIRFVENLTLVGDESGKPVKLLPFQKEILSVLFGTLDRAGRRKIKKAFLFLPRKSAKTFLAACIVLYWLLGRGLKGQQCLSVANDKDQAGRLFEMARQMIEADETLSSLVNIVPSTKHLAVEALFSFYAALSSEGSTKTAYNPSLVIVDEAQDLIDAQLVRNLTSGRTARDDYLTLYIGTAGCRKDTLFYEEYEYAKKWKAGIVENDTYHAWVYESPEEDDWTLESSWKYHPAWGTFCKPQNVRDEFKAAKDNHSEEIKFKQFFLNRWQIYSGVNWIADRDWMANSEPPLGDGKEYYAGYDGASVYDTTSLVLFGANSQGSWDVIPYIWINESQLEQRKTAEFDYQQWQKAGFLQVIPGPIQDEDVIAARIKEVIERYPVKMFSIDRNGQTKMTIHLQSMGFVPGQSLVGFGQGAVSMSEPIKQIERLVIGKQLRHGGHPVLRWMCSNVKLNRDDKENYSFSKKHSKEKIDGCVALACAVGVAVPAISTAAVGLGQSVYETRGLLVL